MKKIFSTIMMSLFAVAMMGQQAVITFEKTEHDFGKINEADGRVSVVFNFKHYSDLDERAGRAGPDRYYHRDVQPERPSGTLPEDRHHHFERFRTDEESVYQG